MFQTPALITGIALFFCGLQSLAAAGAVDFSNDRMFGIPADRKVYFADGTPVVGFNYLAQLYYGASADSLTPVLAPPLSFRNVSQTDPLAGTWFGAYRTFGGFSAGDRITLQVRVWNGTLAGSYEEAVGLPGSQHGVSTPFTYFVPPIPGDWNSYMENLRSFSLVPEPSLIALVLFGFGGLWLLKRRLLPRSMLHGRRGAPTVPAAAHVQRPSRISARGRDAAPRRPP